MEKQNMMKIYLGDSYSGNHLKNFCLYWMKGRETEPKWENTEEGKERYDRWRAMNDLDCLYFAGDLRADTLMSAWTPIKWVADYFNRDYGMIFSKKAKGDPDYYLKLLADDRDAYLPPKHELTLLLDRFLELAEQRCNYILLPDREMNCARYNCNVNGRNVRLYDEVPATLYHIFDKDWLGKYFGQTDEDGISATKWVKREHLECGFENGIIDRVHVIPLITGLAAGDAKMMTMETEIREALKYMIKFLEARQLALEKCPYIMIVEKYKLAPDDLSMGYYSEFIYGEALMDDGTIIPLHTETEWSETREFLTFLNSKDFSTGSYPIATYACVRTDYAEIFNSKRARGKTYFSILHEISKEIVER